MINSAATYPPQPPTDCLSELQLLPLTAGNFCLFKEDILASEEIFPLDIRETADTYLEALHQDRALGYIARLGDRYLGNVVGFALDRRQLALLRLEELALDLDDLVYLFNIVTMPEFHGNSFGRELLQAFLLGARDTGFKKIGGHFRNNGSLKNFKTLGGLEIRNFDNWFNTGENYIYCELELG